MTNLADLSAIDLLAGYRAGDFSPSEAMEAVIARADACEPRLAALYAYDPGAARLAAAQSTVRWHSGAPVRPLDGVPVTVKELIATQGVPVPLGTAATDLVPAPADAPAAARLREAGAIIFAKTTVPDYAMLSSGLSSFHPLTRNPWHLDRNPGGSSAGAAAASAAGYGPLHVGTDIGGSIRLPAGWCGIFGLKPSFGRVPVDPPYIGRVAGPMTRTVADSALLMGTLSQPDYRDHMALPPGAIDWSAIDMDVAGLRIGLMMDAGCGLPVDPAIAAAVTAAARALEAAGAFVEPVAPIISREMLDGLDRFWRTRFWSDVSQMPDARRNRILPFIRQWVEGADGIGGVDVYRGFAQIDAMASAAHRALEPFDFLISPTAPIAAFAAEAASPTGDPARPFEHIAFTVAFNMSGQPAGSVNCGFTAEGLPIGLQIVARRFDDMGVLRLAQWIEATGLGARPWPDLA
ncbi:aspartyl-tRNA(Asn)/glutamyl-tRNA(Gln) amidotransferase subunit A [Sphingomonas laterariae]|uniref:Aspartyl-tRNA(Asn)/glutamyl-tRNA(Gln) amidotransferase subunit A n=1 Tax=Edaphosphingomonas laterariae TaxID=861865 RepID=A0A239GZC3_9SPHN|nr:amidase [Sphingomonas laterariae]SNS74261.1 aspartyl-tRNA(Asn)/glutamyl-tRNA(Gln) amidotransferase subunit A [Sphingomonas laterariae]